jgi:predicted PhzF superfamily epimerase YddE/YHI9
MRKLEVPLCGHGTLAAAAAVFRDTYEGAEGPTAIRFEATSGKFLIARKVEEDHVEIDLDSETSEALSVEEDVKLQAVLAKALGENVPVRYTGCIGVQNMLPASISDCRIYNKNKNKNIVIL